MDSNLQLLWPWARKESIAGPDLNVQLNVSLPLLPVFTKSNMYTLLSAHASEYQGCNGSCFRAGYCSDLPDLAQYSESEYNPKTLLHMLKSLLSCRRSIRTR